MQSMVDKQRSAINGLAKLGNGVRANSDAKTQAGLGRGAGQSKKIVNAAWTNTFPAQGATLDLDFANDRGFVRGIGQGRSMDAVTFTRATIGTFVNNLGLVEDGAINQPRFDWASTATVDRRNLLRNTATFTPLWTLTGTATLISSATVTPSGTTDAFRLQLLNATDSLTQSVTIAIAGNHQASIYVKSRTGFTQSVRFGVSGSSALSVGTAWQRIELTANLGTGSRVYNLIYDASAVDIDIWHPQLEVGTVATEYEENGAFLPSYTPLLANPTSNGLLIEESRTNRILWCRDATKIGTNLVNYSEQFDNAFWVKTGLLAFGSGSVANTTATTDPLGGNTADLIVENGNNDFHTMSSTSGFPVAAIGGVYVASIYVKRPTVNGRRYFQITFSQGAFQNVQYATFDLQDGVVSGSAATVGTPVMTDVGNGWYRCSVAATATATASSLVFFILTNAPTGRSPSYQGDGTSGVYIWGAQVEETFLGNYTATTTAPIIGWRNINVTVAKNQTGIDGVANACSSLTATSANGYCVQTINLVSGLRTASVYLKRITGTGTIQVTLDGTTYSTVDLSTLEWRRIVLSGTITNPTVGIRIVTSGNAVAMDFGQVEDGTFVTSPIMTTSAVGGVTRSADVASMTGNNFDGWMSEFGTISGNHLYFYTGDAGESAPSATGSPCAFGNGTTNQFQPFVLFNVTTRTRQLVGYYRTPILALTLYDSSIDNAYPGNTFLSWAVRIQTNDYAISTNIINELLDSRAIDRRPNETIKTRFVIGGNASQTGFSGYIKYLKFFPVPENANSLQLITRGAT